MLRIGDHLDDKGLPHRGIKRIDNAEKQAQQDNVPYLNDTGEDCSSQYRRLKHGKRLGSNQQTPPIPPVGKHPGKGSEQERRNLTCETDNTQQKGRPG